MAAHVEEGDAGQTGVLIELNSETDFVAKNLTFLGLAEKVLATAVTSSAADAEALLASGVDGASLQGLVDETAATLGTRLYVNLAVAEHAREVAALPVDGVGLLRAEFMVADALGGVHPRLLMERGEDGRGSTRETS